MPGFDEAVVLVLRHEGGYANDPADPGGETNFGISKREFPHLDIRALTTADATALYQQYYWQPIQGDFLPWPLAVVTFDAAVNSGVGQASKWLQAAVGVAVDGVIGPKTLTAAQRHPDPIAAALACCQSRLLMLVKLGTWPAFGANWTHRVLDTFRAAVVQD